MDSVATTDFPSNGTFAPILPPPFCMLVLSVDIGNSGVRAWDLAILIPNALFFLYLLWKLRIVHAKMRLKSVPVILAFYVMVFIVAAVGVIRCVVSMTVNASYWIGDVADKMIWLVLRFFLLATEMSVVVFGLVFGRLDSKISVILIPLVSSVIALIYSVTQGVLELKYPDPHFHISDNGKGDYDLFAHGGMLFWFISSLVFVLVYFVIWILPWTPLRTKIFLPTRKSFYWYCAFLAAMNALQAVGSGLIYFDHDEGLCIVDITTYAYFSAFHILVYLTFLKASFRLAAMPDFSYKPQADDRAESDNEAASDHLPLPHQSSSSDSKEFLDSNLFDSTRFTYSSWSSSIQSDAKQTMVN